MRFAVLMLVLVLPLAPTPTPALAQTWSPGPPMVTARWSFPLVGLPSGKVLAAGGIPSTGGNHTAAAEVYTESPGVGTWTSVPDMPMVHRNPFHGVRLNTGEALIVGDHPGELAPKAHLYNETTNLWSTTANDPSLLRSTAYLIVLPSGNALYFGGYSGAGGSAPFNSAEILNSASKTWSGTGAMATARFGHLAAVLTIGPNVGKVLACGGFNQGPAATLASCELYDPVAGTWSDASAADMGTPRALFTLTPLPDGRILAVGGQTLTANNQKGAEIYDPVTNTWTAVPAMTVARGRHTATVLPSGKVLVVGGAQSGGTGSPTATAEVYDPVANTWTAHAGLVTARSNHSVVMLPNGKLLVAGGADGAGVAIASTEMLTVPSCSEVGMLAHWTADGTAVDAVGGHVGTLVGDTHYVTGVHDQAFSFDGMGDRVVIAPGPAANSFSISAWIRYEADLYQWPWRMVYGRGVRGFSLKGRAINYWENDDRYIGTIQVPFDVWTHVALTYDSPTCTFTGYVNGVADHSTTHCGASLPSGANLGIGGHLYGPEDFHGRIDDVRVLSCALRQGEVEGIVFPLPPIPQYNLSPEPVASPPSAACIDVPHTGGIDIARTDPCSDEAPEGPYAGLLDDSGLMYGSGVGVYPHSGELYETEVDLEIPGRGFNWKLERKYRSGVTYTGILGTNWFMNYGGRALAVITAENMAGLDPGTGEPLAPGDVLRLDGYGRADVYMSNGDSTFTAPAGYFTVLVQNPDDTFTERDASGYRVDYGVPDADGTALMTALADRHGNTMRFEHDAGYRLIRVLDTLGRPIDYQYDASGRLDYVEDFIGRRVTFGYDVDGNLVSVTSPAVTGTPNGNDFPTGKTTRYAYSSGFGDPVLNHNLTSITAANEVVLDPDGPPRVQAVYDAEDRVTSFTVGGTNASLVPAGGTRTYAYSMLPDTDPMDLNLPLAETEVFDSAGNRTVYQFNRAGSIVTTRAYTNRDVRPGEPAFYETAFLYNADGKLVRMTHPAGNSVEYSYDSGNPDPLQQGNLLAEVRLPDVARGGDQAQIVTTYTYEPLYSQIRSVTDPRGNDPGFVPPNGGANSPARYRLQSTFDYEEACDFAAIGAPRGLTAAEAQALLTAAGMCAAPLGDVNGDGLTTSALGDEIRRAAPTVTLLAGSNMAAVEGGVAQPVVSLLAYNTFGQLAASRDPEGNLTTYRYHPENDPDGDGADLTAGVGAGPFGYLAGQTVDAGRGGDCNADGAVNAGDLSALSLEVFDADGTAWNAVGGSTFAGNPGGCDANRDTQVDAADFACEVLLIFGGPAACGTGALSPAASRNSGTNPPTVDALTLYTYDRVGNVVRMVDGRGIATDYAVNALNQVVETTRAAAHGLVAPSPAEPEPLVDFAYRERTFYDANDHVVRTQSEDRGDTSGVGADNAGSGTAFVDRELQYDILDQRIRVSEEVSDTLDLVTRYRYDANGNLALVIQPEGNAVAAVFDERDLVFTETRGADSPPADALLAPGDPTDYDVRGGVPSTQTTIYDANRQAVEVCDGADTDGSPDNNCTVAGGGDRARAIYDGFDRLTSTVDSVGNQAVVQYDPAGNAIRMASFGPVGGASPTSDGPDPLLQPVSSAGSIVPANLVTTNLLTAGETRHDEVGRAYETGQALFVNTIGTVRPADVADGAADIGKGDLTPGDTCAVPGLAAPPSGWLGCVTTRAEFDRSGRQTFAVEDDGDSSRIFYDGADRAIKALDAAGNIAEVAYDDSGNKIEAQLTDKPLGVSVPDEVFLTTWFYDSLDRAQRRVDNLGNATDLRYDSRDNLVAMADAEGPVTGAVIARRAFAGGALTVNAINDYGNVSRYQYDGLDRRLREDTVLTASGEGDGVNIGADLFGVPAALPPADPAQGGGDGLITRRDAWDGNGLPAHLTDDNGNRTLADYDNLNRQIAETHGICVPPMLADSCDPPTTFTLDLDPDDNLQTWTDEAGSVTALLHDAANRRLSQAITRAPGVVGTTAQTYTYDGLSRRVGATDNNEPATALDNSAVTMAYDSLSRLIEETQVLGAGPARAVSAAWRAEDLRTGLTYPNDRRVDAAFDDLDRLLDVRDTGAPAAIAEYAWIGQAREAERRHPGNGTRLSYLNDAGTADIGYDGLRQPIQLRHLRANDSLVAGLTHGFDRSQDPLGEGKLHNPANDQTYSYDSASRLVTFDRQAGGALPPLHSDFKLDGAGNWKQVDAEPRQHSSFNELILRSPGGPIPILSDTNGNLTDDGTQLYTYDARNRLRGVSSKATGLPIAAYTYDALDRRVRKVVTNSGGLNGTTDVAWDDWREIESRDAVGTLVHQVVFGWRLDEPVVLDRNTGGGTTATGPGDQRLTYHASDRQSIFALTDATGKVVEGYQYDAYGHPVVYTPGPNGSVDWGGDDVVTPGGASALGNPSLFTGRRWDPETGLYHYRTRHHHPVLGRFVSRDVIGFWGDPGNLGNGYAYVGNAPIRYVDPFGMDKIKRHRRRAWKAINKHCQEYPCGAFSVIPDVPGTGEDFGAVTLAPGEQSGADSGAAEPGDVQVFSKFSLANRAGGNNSLMVGSGDGGGVGKTAALAGKGIPNVTIGLTKPPGSSPQKSVVPGQCPGAPGGGGGAAVFSKFSLSNRGDGGARVLSKFSLSNRSSGGGDEGYGRIIP